MERKKSKKSDLRNYRKLLLGVSMLISLSVVLLAFEWGFSDTKGKIDFKTNYSEEDIIPVVFIEKKIEPPKPKQVQKIEIIDNSEPEPKNEIEFTSETSQTELIDVDIDDLSGDDPVDDIDIVFNPGELEHKAVFPGGDKALLDFIRKNAKYPKSLKTMNIQGTVWVRFVINKKGKATNIEIMRSPDPEFSKSAIETIEKLPKFKPATQNGKAVKMYYIVPIKFKLI